MIYRRKMQKIQLGIAELIVVHNPATIVTIVGSCVAVSFRDPVSRIGGMVHIVLPDANQASYKEPPEKFADTGIEMAVREMLKKGCLKNRIESKIAGGANMFSGTISMRIGEKNVEAVKQKLAEMNIPILASDTGGNYGRTVEFHIETGEMVVKTAFKGIKKL